MARLDRVGPAKEVAQVGAALGRKFSHPLLALMRTPATRITIGPDRLAMPVCSFARESADATYLFKHALVQDAAYGTLLREPRRALHARIAETLERDFPDIAENQLEILARHCTEAGLIEKAAGLWGKAGQRSLERSALVEAAAQITRALDQIAAVPATPVLRREEIKLQVALANALMHVEGYAAPETKAAVEQARVFVERAEELGESPNDPLLLFSVLYGVWAVNALAFNGDTLRDLAAQFLALAEGKAALAPDSMATCCMPETSPRRGCTSNRRLRYTIPPSIGRWPRDLVKTLRCTPYPIGRWPCGRLAILRPPKWTLTRRSMTRVKSAKLQL